jgi:hypothetical protein
MRARASAREAGQRGKDNLPILLSHPLLPSSDQGREGDREAGQEQGR